MKQLVDDLIKLEQHEKPNYLHAKTIWDKWLKVRNQVTGNPSDHPLYPYRHRDKIYYEQLGEAISKVIRHLKFEVMSSNKSPQD
jgi:hypothetical protein